MSAFSIPLPLGKPDVLYGWPLTVVNIAAQYFWDFWDFRRFLKDISVSEDILERIDDRGCIQNVNRILQTIWQ